jgi:hypothetical protein
LLHEWGNGQIDEEWVRIREEARSLFEQAGVPSPFHPGVRSETAIEEALDGLRVVRETDVVLGPGPSITLRNSSDVSPRASCRTSGAYRRTCARNVFRVSGTGRNGRSTWTGQYPRLVKSSGPCIASMLPNTRCTRRPLERS